MTSDPRRSDEANAVSEERHPRDRQRMAIRGLKAIGGIVLVWWLLAYVILPSLWQHYEHHPAMEDAPKVSVTAQGIPGDPLNVGLIGDEKTVIRAMTHSGWNPADPVTLRTSLEIASSVVRDRPYLDAPVSPLFVFGRKQDLAFEKPAGENASRRHHVRLWKSDALGHLGMPLWIGAVTYDESVGLSHRTGQITHHIGADIDAERDALITSLRDGRWLDQVFQVTGVGATMLGRNGGGDLYYTDGELTIGVLLPDEGGTSNVKALENPPTIQIKEQLWAAIRPLVRQLVPGSLPD